MTQSRDLAISVVIPSFNCASYLAEAINSALEQSLAPAEVLVIDDGSTDHTAEVAAAFGDRIRFISLPHAGRPSVPRNVGLKLATAEFVAPHDADDIMLPGKLQAASDVFLAYPEVEMLFTDFRAIDEKGSVIKSSYLSEYQAFRACLRHTTQPDLFLADGKALFRQLLYANFIGTPSVVARRELFLGLGGFDESLANGCDVDLWYRVARAGHTIAFLDRPSFDYRARSASISSRGSARYPSMIRVLKDQLPFTEELAEREDIARRLSELTLSYAYRLRQEGDWRRAVAVYGGEFRRQPSWQALRGLMLTGPLRFLSFLGREH